VLEGRSDPESWACHNEVWRDWSERGRWDSRIEGGESFLDMRARFEPFVQSLQRFS
jgi:broad specificity phosphatase PhoE